MGGTTRRTRRALAVAGIGIAATAVGVLAPTAAGAASSRPANDRETPQRVLSAQLQSSPLQANDIRALVAMQRIVTPVDGGDLAVYDSPGANVPSQVLPAINELDSPLTLLTVASMGDWYQVLLPTRPNGATAWIPASSVNVAVPQYRVELSLSALDLKVVSIADGSVVMTSPIGIGSPSTPTPSGLFFVRDHFPTYGGNSHPYGPFAFGLSGHSDVYMQFGTGDGRIAIHGTNQPASIGAASSNGCPHVPNDVVLALIPYMPLGTPVLINP